VVKETSSSAIKGEEEIAKRFYRKHKSIKKLFPSQLLGSQKSFQEFLERMFSPEKETGEPINNAGKVRHLLFPVCDHFFQARFLL